MTWGRKEFKVILDSTPAYSLFLEPQPKEPVNQESPKGPEGPRAGKVEQRVLHYPLSISAGSQGRLWGILCVYEGLRTPGLGVLCWSVVT